MIKNKKPQAPSESKEPTILDESLEHLPFEEALARLEEIVRALESGNLPLDQAITHYETGAQLKRLCERQLQLAQKKIDLIVLSDSGTPEGVVPLDTE